MRRNDLALWGIFCIAFFLSYLILNQQGGTIAGYSYIISAFISVSAMFVADRVLKKRSANEAAQNPGSSKKRTTKVQTTKDSKAKKEAANNSQISKKSSSNGKKKR